MNKTLETEYRVWCEIVSSVFLLRSFPSKAEAIRYARKMVKDSKRNKDVQRIILQKREVVE